MARWLISAPAWGARCVDVFCATALPALERAALALRAADPEADVRLVVHTDAPDRVVQVASQVQVDARAVPAGLRDFDCLSQAHREVLGMACRGDVVVLLTADLVISTGGLAFCKRALDNPQKAAVVCATCRARQEGRLPDNLDGATLARWAWENRHPITDECTWPRGRSADLSRLFFAAEGSVRTRQALPHPLAVKVDGRPLSFSTTIDVNLMQRFDWSEIHYATDSSDLALVELSPPDKATALHALEMEPRHRAGGIVLTDPLQQWCAGHQVSWCGVNMDCGDDAVLNEVLHPRTTEEEQQP